MESTIYRNKIKNMPWWVFVGVQTVVCCMAIQKNTLIQLEWGYPVDIPIIKYLFAIFQKMNGWGIDVIFQIAGIACLICLVRDCPLQKNKWIRILAIFFCVCTVFGKSYYDLGNWNYIFHGKLQFGLACFVMLGYYWLFKNLFVLLKWVWDKYNFARVMPKGKIESWLFEKHSFSGPLIVTLVCYIPFFVCFFPGLLHVDAMEQCWSYLGAFPWRAHHPVGVTWLLGQCLSISRRLIGNDMLAILLYATTQYITQLLVVSYAGYILSKLKAPILLRWFSVLYFSVFPLWMNWGFIVVKDSFFYIFILLLLLVLIHIWRDEKIHWWQWILLCICGVGVSQMRNNGTYILIILCTMIVIMKRKYWTVCIPILVCMFASNYLVQDVYMEMKGIPDGEVGEMLSVPLQQTARYVKEHYDEITQEEMEVLASLFEVEVQTLGELYNPELSDPVKAEFKDSLTSEEMMKYLDVWFAQLMKHPDTYIQAFLNQIYGYFYPDRENFWGITGLYACLGGRQYWEDGQLNFKFAMEYRELRDMYSEGQLATLRFPIIGMLYSAGLHNYILIGCFTALLARKRYKDIVVLIPALVTVLICLVSPVNAYVRYMLPVMVTMPINIAWCYCVIKEDKADQK